MDTGSVENTPNGKTKSINIDQVQYDTRTYEDNSMRGMWTRT